MLIGGEQWFPQSNLIYIVLIDDLNLWIIYEIVKWSLLQINYFSSIDLDTDNLIDISLLLSDKCFKSDTLKHF